MTFKPYPRIYILFSLGLLQAACSTAPRQTASDPRSEVSSAQEVQNSSQNKKTLLTEIKTAQSRKVESRINIEYMLGNDHYRFLIAANLKSVTGNSFINHQILEQAEIQWTAYSPYLKKVTSFILGLPAQPALPLPSCRAPFKVSIQIGKKLHARKGCRTEESAAELSNLIREGEFLLYSQK